jgi:hypothetical protein
MACDNLKFEVHSVAQWGAEILRKSMTFLSALVLLGMMTGANINFMAVFGWSNGNFSDDPSNPKYGTHDWIAEHALDWLPLEEKRYVLNNLASYLYGTELPDSRQAPDRIGDTAKHHVYYFANSSLQSNASAVRAQQEYGLAVSCFKSGDLVDAAKRLGAMSHYICDVAVFGHVMGSETDWGNEMHHDDYERYVNTRTNNYTDEFNTFLAFDGVLNDISAYNATLALAYDTTFDVDGGLTCVWMDQNYNWTNPTFENRCGESLNLAVNLIADVLHTFYVDVSKHHIDVPFYYQEKDYYCGPACLEMVFDYYGEDVSQSEIADAARSIGEPIYSTFSDELRRAAHFSNASTSMGDELPEEITGYTSRGLGYAASEAHSMGLAQLKDFMDRGKPLILLMWYSSYHVYGHYRVATGYNETHVFLHDPWNKPLWGGAYGGPDIAFSYTEFLDLWSYYGNWALYASPWTMSFSAPAYIKPGTPFQVKATIAYPQALPNALSDYPASLCNATLTLPANLSLDDGEVEKKTVGAGFLEAGGNSTIGWMLVANSSLGGRIAVEVEGLISGSVDAHGSYSAYGYGDRIGATADFTMEFTEDDKPPLIDVPIRVPQGDVEPNQAVKVSVNITDLEGGVQNVMLKCNMNNGTAWEFSIMNYDESTGLYELTIPGKEAGTYVRFEIVAYDWVGNVAMRDGTEPYCTYQIVPEFPLGMVPPLFMVITMCTALYAKKKRGKRK